MRAAILIAAFWLTSLAAGQNALETAVEFVRHGEYAKAREQLLGATEPTATAQRIAFHRLKAAIASGLKEPAAAAQEMEQALAPDPTNANLLLAAAVAELDAGLLDAALLHAKTSKESALREFIIGRIQEGRSLPEALQAYQAAIRLARKEERYRIALGLGLLRHQEFGPAVEALTTASREIHSASILTLLGIAQFAYGFPERAEQALNEAITAEPRGDAAYAVLATVVLQSSAAPARGTSSHLCSWNKTVCSALDLRIARETNDAAMLERATEVLKATPSDDPIGRCELARAYEWQDNLPGAAAELETCVKLDPSPRNHYRLGLVYRRLGRTELAAHEMEIRRKLLGSLSDQSAASLKALDDAGIQAK